jgi:hypothetical protein
LELAASAHELPAFKNKSHTQAAAASWCGCHHMHVGHKGTALVLRLCQLSSLSLTAQQHLLMTALHQNQFPTPAAAAAAAFLPWILYSS